MTKTRLATYALGAATIVAAFLVPLPDEARMALVAAGMGLLGLATRWPQDQPPPPPVSGPPKS